MQVEDFFEDRFDLCAELAFAFHRRLCRRFLRAENETMSKVTQSRVLTEAADDGS